jgi:hypothetical protein
LVFIIVIWGTNISEFIVIFRTNIRTDLESKLIFGTSANIRLARIKALEYILVIGLGIRAISRRKVIRIISYIINTFKLVFYNFFRSN